MRHLITALVFAGAFALVIPCTSFAQRGGGHAGGFSGGGHVGGFSGGHVGGFPGGGFTAPRFTAPSGGFRANSLSAPRMNLMPGPVNSGVNRFAPSRSYYGGQRSPFGQLSAPQVRRAPYPGAGNHGWTNQPAHTGNSGNNQWHGGDHHGDRDGDRDRDRDGDRDRDRDRDHDGHDHYRHSYYGGVTYWPYWPYFGNWDSDSEYTSSPGNTVAPAQSPDQYYAPETAQQETDPPAYQPGIVMAPSSSPVPQPAVTIVYKDGHSQQIHNYVLTRTTLLMLDNASSGLAPQVPLDQINLPVTEQANRAQGVNFSLPAKN